jgi:hypothetical protein
MKIDWLGRPPGLVLARGADGRNRSRYTSLMSKPNDKVIVKQYDGKQFRGIVILTETFTTGVKVRVRSGDFILNVDEKQVAKDD